VPDVRDLLLDDPRYYRFLAATHPHLRISNGRLQVPSYVATLDVREPLLKGPVKAALEVGKAVTPGYVTPRALFLGTPFERYDQTHLFDEIDDVPALTRAAERAARRLDAELVVITCVQGAHRRAHDFTHAGFVELPSFPDTVVTLHGDSFDEHLATLPQGDRSGVRRNIRRFERAGHTLKTVSSTRELGETLYAAYRPMFDRAAVKWLPHTPAYFEGIADLDERVHVTVAFNPEHEAIGFIVNFEDGLDDAHRRVFQAGRIGVLPAYHRKDAVYFRLMYHVLEEAIARGGTHLSLEPTGYRMKRHLGADKIPLVNLVYGVSPTWRLLLGGAAGLGRFLLRHLEDPGKLEGNY
jgi:hypothetical protein